MATYLANPNAQGPARMMPVHQADNFYAREAGERHRIQKQRWLEGKTYRGEQISDYYLAKYKEMTKSIYGGTHNPTHHKLRKFRKRISNYGKRAIALAGPAAKAMAPVLLVSAAGSAALMGVLGAIAINEQEKKIKELESSNNISK